MTRTINFWGAGAIVLIALATVTSGANAEGGSTISGKVTWDGPTPVRKPIQMIDRLSSGLGPTRRDCAKKHGDTPALTREEIVAEDGGVKNAFVYVSKGLDDTEYAVPEEMGKLNQEMCFYEPRVQGILVGQKFEIVNSDGILHNIRSHARRNKPFNIAQPPEAEPRVKSFRRAEESIKLRCDVHQWMTGYIFAMEHPFFATTGEDGTFSIQGLPAGDYELTAWHEVYGELEADITVGSSGEITSNFAFSPKES